jgi:hypothetical protein
VKVRYRGPWLAVLKRPRLWFQPVTAFLNRNNELTLNGQVFAFISGNTLFLWKFWKIWNQRLFYSGWVHCLCAARKWWEVTSTQNHNFRMLLLIPFNRMPYINLIGCACKSKKAN